MTKESFPALSVAVEAFRYLAHIEATSSVRCLPYDYVCLHSSTCVINDRTTFGVSEAHRQELTRYSKSLTLDNLMSTYSFLLNSPHSSKALAVSVSPQRVEIKHVAESMEACKQRVSSINTAETPASDNLGKIEDFYPSIYV